MVVIEECITRAETSALANDVVLTECIWRAAGMGVTTKPAGPPWQTHHNKLHYQEVLTLIRDWVDGARGGCQSAVARFA